MRLDEHERLVLAEGGHLLEWIASELLGELERLRDVKVFKGIENRGHRAIELHLWVLGPSHERAQLDARLQQCMACRVILQGCPEPVQPLGETLERRGASVDAVVAHVWLRGKAQCFPAPHHLIPHRSSCRLLWVSRTKNL